MSCPTISRYMSFNKAVALMSVIHAHQYTKPSRHLLPGPPSPALTHVLAANFGPAFFQAVLYVFFLVSFVVPQPSDEVVKGFLEPAVSLSAGLAHVLGPRERPTWRQQVSLGTWAAGSVIRGSSVVREHMKVSSCCDQSCTSCESLVGGSRKGRVHVASSEVVILNSPVSNDE